jgi:hypothetical protein
VWCHVLGNAGTSARVCVLASVIGLRFSCTLHTPDGREEEKYRVRRPVGNLGRHERKHPGRMNSWFQGTCAVFSRNWMEHFFNTCNLEVSCDMHYFFALGPYYSMAVASLPVSYRGSHLALNERYLKTLTERDNEKINQFEHKVVLISNKKVFFDAFVCEDFKSI